VILPALALPGRSVKTYCTVALLNSVKKFYSSVPSLLNTLVRLKHLDKEWPNGTTRFEKCKQLLEYQKLLLHSDISGG